jgi:hypothetical protein
MLRKLKSWCLALPVFLFTSVAVGQCIPTLCSLTISIQSDAAGIMLGGSGTSAASMSFGTMQAYGGTTPSGVTKSVGTTNWTISTPFDIKVTCTNLLNFLPCTIVLTPTYNLTAQLQTSDSVNTWKIGGSALSSSSAVTITSGGTYGSVVAYSFALTIPFSEASGTISNTVNFTAISN